MADETPKTTPNCTDKCEGCGTPEALRKVCTAITDAFMSFKTSGDPNFGPDDVRLWDQFRQMLWQFSILFSAQIDASPDESIGKFIEELERIANIERKRKGLPISTGVQIVRVAVDPATSEHVLAGWDARNATKH